MSFTVSLERDKTHPSIAVITVDNPPVNAMSIGVPGAIIARLEEAQADRDIAGVVLCAGGSGGFAGADIRVQGKAWPEDEPTLSEMVARLENSTLPVAALLRRNALGGGLEIGMACRYRVATPGTQLGQPEVKLGIPPGGGGTQRLPRLTGVQAALDMIVGGDPIDAKKGHDIGLIDALAASDDPVSEAAAYLASQVESGLRPPTRDRSVDGTDPTLFESARTVAARKQRGQLAPLACIDCVEASTTLPFDEGLKFERQKFGECVSSDQAAAMRHAFFAERQIGKVPGLAKNTPVRDINTVMVIGAGTMGSGIAMCFANAGIAVTLVERQQEALDRGLSRIAKTYAGMAEKVRLSSEEAQRRTSLVTGALSVTDGSDCDLVVEAVFEDMDVKKSVFSELASVMKPGAILATNTSYLDVDEIAASTGDRAGDVVGLHFFSPANIMKLMEIVRAERTELEVLASAIALGRKLGKIGIVVGVCNGFVGNRVYSTYVRETEFLLEEGATPSQVDGVLTEFGMAMGIFAVRDLAGLDIGWANRKATAHLRDPVKRYCKIGDTICENGWFGQKTGRGFYLYEEGSRTPKPDPDVDAIISKCAVEGGISQRQISNEEIVERAFDIMVNEGAKILEEGIALRASDIDLAMINGYGFPRWRGGPMCWAGTIGLGTVVARMRKLSETHDFWEPAPLLVRLAEEGKTFADWDRENA